MMSTIGVATRNKTSRLDRGLTLFEILAVIVVIALLMSVGLPQLNTLTSVNLRSASRKMSGLIKVVYNNAIMKKVEHRLALNLDERTFWVEVLVEPVVPNDPENEENNEDDEDNEEPKNYYEKTKGYLSRPGVLPNGVSIVRYLSQELKQDVRSGIAYLYFYPEGETTGGFIFFESSNEMAMTLEVNQLTGQVKNHKGVLDINDAA